MFSVSFPKASAKAILHREHLLLSLSRTLRGPADAATVPSHGDGLLLLKDILEELLGAGELPAIDGLGGLACILEGNTEV